MADLDTAALRALLPIADRQPRTTEGFYERDRARDTLLDALPDLLAAAEERDALLGHLANVALEYTNRRDELLVRCRVCRQQWPLGSDYRHNHDCPLYTRLEAPHAG